MERCLSAQWQCCGVNVFAALTGCMLCFTQRSGNSSRLHRILFYVYAAARLALRDRVYGCLPAVWVMCWVS